MTGYGWFWYISTMAHPWGRVWCLWTTPQVNNKVSIVTGASLEPYTSYSLMVELLEPLLWLDIAVLGIYPPWHIPGGEFGAFEPLPRSITRSPQSPELDEGKFPHIALWWSSKWSLNGAKGMAQQADTPQYNPIRQENKLEPFTNR